MYIAKLEEVGVLSSHHIIFSRRRKKPKHIICSSSIPLFQGKHGHKKLKLKEGREKTSLLLLVFVCVPLGLVGFPFAFPAFT